MWEILGFLGMLASTLVFGAWLIVRRYAAGVELDSRQSAVAAAAGIGGEAVSDVPPAPASPHLLSAALSAGRFLDPHGVCSRCFRPRNECDHQVHEHFTPS